MCPRSPHGHEHDESGRVAATAARGQAFTAITAAPRLRVRPDDAPSATRQTAALLFGFELKELAPARLEERLDAAGRFYLLLPQVVSAGYKLSCGWQILCSPSSARARPGSDLALALVVRVSALWGQSAHQLRAAAHATCREIEHLLEVSMPDAWFAPITDRRRLSAFHVLPQVRDLVEFHSAWVPISETLVLPTPLSGTTDLAFLADELRAEGCTALLSLAFEPADGLTSLLPLLSLASGMSGDSGGDAGGDSVGALLAGDGEQGASHDDDEDADRGLPGERYASQPIVARWLSAKLPPLRDACRVGLRLAATRPLSPGFLALCAAEFAGEGRLMAGQTWRRPSVLFSPDAVAQRPRSGHSTQRPGRASAQDEWAIAHANLTRLEFTRWGDPDAARIPMNIPGFPSDMTPAALARLVSREELARLLPLPLSASWLPTHMPALPVNLATLPTEGAFLGTTRWRRERANVYWPTASRVQQACVTGATGAGKSTFVGNLALEDIRAGDGTIVLDAHGTLIDAILPRIPRERIEDVILLDVEDTERPLGYNSLDLRSPEEQSRFVTSFIAQLERLFDPNRFGFVGPVAMQGLRAALQGLLSTEEGGTLIEVSRLFTDESYLRQMLPRMRDRSAVGYFRRFLAMRGDEQAGHAIHISSKLSEWAADPIMRRIVGQRTSSFSFAEAMATRKIVLLRLASGFIGTEKATFLGHSFLPAIFQASLERALLPAAERHFVSLILDEAPVFASDVIANILAQSRKGSVGVLLAGQNFNQFLPSIREAILANANSILAFRCGVPDGALLERVFASPAVSERYLTQLPVGKVVSRILLENGEPSQPFLLETDLLRGTADPDVERAIREHSRMTYGRPREEVDREIAEREGQAPSSKPSLQDLLP